MLPIILLGGLLLYFVGIYNKLVKLKVRIDEAWSQIDIQLKRRADLIPNLVETVKGYAKHEKEVFDSVNEARQALLSAKSVPEVEEANKQLTGALGRLLAVAEAYPDLKAQESFASLQRELADTEDKVAYSRQFYNSVVRDYNSMLATFPIVLVAKFLGFEPRPFFEANEEDRQAVKVKF